MRYYPSLSACFSLLCLVCASCTDTRSNTETRAPAPLPSRNDYFSTWQKQTLSEIKTRKVSFAFKDTPLSDVLEALSADTGMTFLLDTSEGEGPPITLTAKEMLLEDALRWIAALADLTWGFRKHHHARGFSMYKPLYFGKDYGFGWVTTTKEVPLEVWWAHVEKLRETGALDKKTVSFRFEETPLSKVLCFLSDLLGIDVHPELPPDSADPPVTLSVNRMSAKNALHWMKTLAATPLRK